MNAAALSGALGLMPLESTHVQAYFSSRISLASLVAWVLAQTGPAALTVTTFSCSEEFLCRLHRLRKEGAITRCSLLCDIRAARKTIKLSRLMMSVCDSVRLCQNHSKVVLAQSAAAVVAIVTSQNQTRGDRYEAGIITTDSAIFNTLRRQIDLMAQTALPVEHIFNAND